jgi:hypothetical protein
MKITIDFYGRQVTIRSKVKKTTEGENMKAIVGKAVQFRAHRMAGDAVTLLKGVYREYERTGSMESAYQKLNAIKEPGVREYLSKLFEVGLGAMETMAAAKEGK